MKFDQCRVLVAEDVYAYRYAIVRLLESLGLTSVAVEDGLDAVALLEDQSQPFDLVITDFRMLRGGGWRVIEAARTHRGASFPVIMQSGESQYADVYERAAELSVPLISKADLFTLLEPAVRKALNLRAG